MWNEDVMNNSYTRTAIALFACSAVFMSASVTWAADTLLSSFVPASGFYAGLGASSNYTNYNDWSVDATGISNVYEGVELIASGSAGGPAIDLDLGSSWSFTPQIQL
jgi:hypothetical protein